MNRIRHTAAHALVLRLSLIVTLVMASFAHVPVTNAETSRSSPVVTAFPDGSIPIICLTDQEDTDLHHKNPLCDFCLIAHGATVAVPPPMPMAVQASFIAPVSLLAFTPRPERVMEPGSPLRAPPVV